MKAVVHNQKYNSPLGLYSADNVAETLANQTKVLTNGAAPVSAIYPKMSNVAGTKSSEVYRMVQNDEDEGKFRGQRPVCPSQASFPILQSQSFLKLQRSLEEDEESESGAFSEGSAGYSPSSPVASPTNFNRRQPQAPAPPPKPGNVAVKPGPGNWTSAAPQPQYNQQPQQQAPRPQQPPQQQAPRPQPQQQQQAPRPQPQQQQQAPRPQQQQYNQQPQQQQYQQAPSPYLSEQERYQLEQAKLQNRPQYQPQFMPQQAPPQRQQQHQPSSPSTNYNKVAPKATSTFQSIIPNESHPGSGGGVGGGFAPPNWSPTTGRKPVWPPPKSQEALLTSSQSIKWGGGSPAKKFIWPPPKDHVQVQEETDDSGYVRVVYREVPDAQRARTYVSPRAPARLDEAAWEPYSGGRSDDVSYNLSSGPGRRLRRFNDLFTPNSTRLPPTYRAPPGTQHVEYE